MALVGVTPTPDIQDLVLKDGVLRTDGALVSMKIPEGWTGRTSTLRTHYSLELSYRFRHPDGRSSVGLSLNYFRGDVIHDVHRDARKLFESDTQLTGPDPRPRSSRERVPLQDAIDDLFLRRSAAQCLGLEIFTFKEHRTAMVVFERDGLRSLSYYLDTFGDLDAPELKNIDEAGGYSPSMYCLTFNSEVRNHEERLPVAVECFESTVWRKDFIRTKPVELIL